MAQFINQDKQYTDDILIPGDRPDIPRYYAWYYRVIVKDKNGTLLSGVEMYDSSGTKVTTINNGKISYYTGRTTTSEDVNFVANFTFKKDGYVDTNMDITAVADVIYTPVVMSKKTAVIDGPVYFDIFVKDGSNDLPISGATINVYADPNYSVSFTAPFKTNDRGFGCI